MEGVFVEESQFVDEVGVHSQDQVEVADPLEDQAVQESHQFLEGAQLPRPIPKRVAFVVVVEVEGSPELEGVAHSPVAFGQDQVAEVLHQSPAAFFEEVSFFALGQEVFPDEEQHFFDFLVLEGFAGGHSKQFQFHQEGDFLVGVLVGGFYCLQFGQAADRKFVLLGVLQVVHQVLGVVQVVDCDQTMHLRVRTLVHRLLSELHSKDFYPLH